jgi:hypothetical protein
MARKDLESGDTVLVFFKLGGESGNEAAIELFVEGGSSFCGDRLLLRRF